ncbi:hypothetical protein SUGI_1076150 [Cryptomeria japonica]|uniref:protein PIN-LIKES 6 n=1 Tax=Cryptomeria japonica TaxID=3369 RepID=UPI002414AF69|nr:protein PIN-LIKES 6 [Cryptomeria japonica]GLJ50506.1 hypothetical protein SUGI_1076150 [Cryptomeria japonica]
MAMEDQNESVFQMLKFSTLPIAKVFVMCLLGFILASKYVNILTPSGRKLLNGLVFTLFLPCLIFTQLGRAVTIQKMLEWWFIPMNIVCGTISGSLIGLGVALFVRPPKEYFKFTIVQIGIGNIGNVPLVLIGAMCRDKNNPFGDSKMCNETGSAYISFGQWVGAVILYTYVFYMLSPPATEDSVADGVKPNTEIADSTRIPLLAAEEGIVDHVSKPLDWRSRVKGVMAEVSSFLERSKIKQILQPPIIASILALVIGITPFLKHLILTDDAPLFFITDSCVILGGAMIPCIMLALGGNLIGGPANSKLGIRTTVAIIFARLILVPPVGLGIVTLADKLGFLPANDKMFRFVLLLQHTMPTSILAGAVANLRGFAEKEASAILFWVHIFAMFSMTMWITLYLNILF